MSITGGLRDRLNITMNNKIDERKVIIVGPSVQLGTNQSQIAKSSFWIFLFVQYKQLHKT